MIWNIKTIGVVIGFFFLGYIIGLVEAAIRQRNKERKKKEAEVQEERKGRELTEPSLLSIKQSSTDRFTLEMEGQTYHSPEFLPNEKRASLVNLLIKLRPWVENAKPGTTPSTKQPTAMKSDNRNPEPASKTGQQKGDNEKPEEETKTGMVAEIDEILQKKLAMSHLENKGVHLLETPAGGVMVFIGMEKYDGIGAVPDSEIKTLIQSAVKEWELKN